MKILPIRDLKDTTNVANVVRESDDPVYVTKNGTDEMILMNPEVYERITAKNEIYSMLLEAERDVAAGNVHDADEVTGEIKNKYDFRD